LVAVASCSEPENWYPLRQTVQVLLGVQIPADAPVDLLDASAILRTVLPGLEAHWAASDFQATKNAMEAAGIVGEADHQKRVRQYLEEKKRRDAGKQ
jgi:hypothetical protein